MTIKIIGLLLIFGCISSLLRIESAITKKSLSPKSRQQLAALMERFDKIIQETDTENEKNLYPQFLEILKVWKIKQENERAHELEMNRDRYQQSQELEANKNRRAIYMLLEALLDLEEQKKKRALGKRKHLERKWE